MFNVLVIGLNRGASFAKIAASSPQLQLAGLIDANESKLREVGQICGLSGDRAFVDLPSALAASRADILVVATPTHLHTAHVTAGLQAGLHVLCEKPLATTREDALFMRDESRRSGRQLAVVQNVRYHPHFRKCKQLIASGEIGSLNRAEFSMRLWRRSTDLKHPHAVLFNHGVHHLDLLRYITSAVAKEIHAIECDPPDPGDAGRGGRILRLTVLSEAGVLICYDGSYADAGGNYAELRVSGSRGTLEAVGDYTDPQLWLSRSAKATGQDVRERIPLAPIGVADIDRLLLEGFAEAIQNGRPMETDVEDNLQTLDWLFRAAEVIERANGAEQRG